METGKPHQVIPVSGVNIKAKEIDPVEQIDQQNIAINVEQFLASIKDYTDPRGWVNVQIVKRRKPSPKGHTHFMRIASKINDRASNDLEDAA